MFLHATTIAIDGRGVLLAGPSGIGKSDLALRLIDQGAALVADDQTELTCRDGALMAASPPALAGLLEVRGVGVMRYPCHEAVSVACYIELVDDPSSIERMPEPTTYSLLDCEVPAFKLLSWAASAPAVVRALIKGTIADDV